MRLTGAPTGTPWLGRDSGPGRKPAHRASAGRKPDPAGEGSPSPPFLTTAGMAKADKLGLSYLRPLANKRVALSLQPGSTDFLPSRFPPVEAVMLCMFLRSCSLHLEPFRLCVAASERFSPECFARASFAMPLARAEFFSRASFGMPSFSFARSQHG